MKGKVFAVMTTGETKETEVNDPNLLPLLREIVEGHIEAVPFFDTYKKMRCVAFCNEEGKLDSLPVNELATLLWYQACGRVVDDVLVGNIAVVTGDEEFLRNI